MVFSHICHRCYLVPPHRGQVKRVRKEAQAAGHDRDADADADKGKKKRGWFGWFGGGTTKVEEDGDVSIEDLGDFVAEKDESKEVSVVKNNTSGTFFFFSVFIHSEKGERGRGDQAMNACAKYVFSEITQLSPREKVMI